MLKPKAQERRRDQPIGQGRLVEERAGPGSQRDEPVAGLHHGAGAVQEVDLGPLQRAGAQEGEEEYGAPGEEQDEVSPASAGGHEGRCRGPGLPGRKLAARREDVLAAGTAHGDGHVGGGQDAAEGIDAGSEGASKGISGAGFKGSG